MAPIGVSGIADVGAGSTHTCAVADAGTVRCWGDGYSGQLGHGLDTRSPTVVDVVGLTDAREVVGGGTHTCALREGGRVACWGAAPALGDGLFEESAVPVDVVGLDDVLKISLGESHSCAVREEGFLSCWGGNGYGQLGIGLIQYSQELPVDVIGVPQSYVLQYE